MKDGAIHLVPGLYITVEPERTGGNDGGTTIRVWREKDEKELYRGDFFRGNPHAHANPIGGNGGGPRHDLDKPLEEQDRALWITLNFRDDLRPTLEEGDNHAEAAAITNEALHQAVREIRDRLVAAGVAA